MDGIPSIRVHNGTDYKGTTRFIRWTEVFLIKVRIRFIWKQHMLFSIFSQMIN